MPVPNHVVLLIHTCHAATLPCSDSAVSFVKVRVVAGNIRTASPTISCFHRAFLKSITFIGRLMHLTVYNSKG